MLGQMVAPSDLEMVEAEGQVGQRRVMLAEMDTLAVAAAVVDVPMTQAERSFVPLALAVLVAVVTSS